MKPISKEVNKLVHKVLKRKDPILMELIMQWSKIVGTKFCTKTYPLKITNYKEEKKYKRILLVNVENSALGMEFSFQQEIILERLAVYLGYRAINKVKVVINFS